MDTSLSRAEHEEFARRMESENKRLEEENNRQNKRIEQLEDAVNQVIMRQLASLTTAIDKLNMSVDNTIKTQDVIEARVKKLEDKDGDMWRTAVKYALSALIGGVVVFALTRLGMG